MALHFQNLPPEIILYILEFLNWVPDAINCSLALTNTFHEDLVTELILGPQLRVFSALDYEIENLFHKEGWTRNCNDKCLIQFLWKKFNLIKGRATFLSLILILISIIGLLRQSFDHIWIRV